MKQGDFTELAKSYHNRAGYSPVVLTALGRYIGAFDDPTFLVADVGAGTGKLTENLLELELRCIAVEPNAAMREEGKQYTSRFDVEWREGSGEETNLDDAAANWLLMASSFHWVNPELGLKEFHRVLKPGGFFTALWNPRNLESSELHMRIEERIYSIAPNIKRVSSGAKKYTEDTDELLISTGHFKDVLYTEARHEVVMTKDRYMGAWRSTNDIQAQAGPEKWEQILMAIEDEIKDIDEVIVPYKTRAFTVQRVD